MLRAGRRVGLAEQGDQVGPAGVGDPGLGAVDDVLVTVPLGGGAYRLQVRAAAGFGQRHGGPQLTGGHPRQVPVLLFLCPVVLDELGDHGVTAHGPGQAHPAARELLGYEHVARSAHLGVAPRRRNGQPEDSELLHRLDELLGIGVRVIQLPDNGFHIPVHELPHDHDDLALLVGQAFHVDLLAVHVVRAVVGWRCCRVALCPAAGAFTRRAGSRSCPDPARPGSARCAGRAPESAPSRVLRRRAWPAGSTP